MQRIAIIGCAGTGKSTLSRRLGAQTGLPVIHLDQHFWKPGWKSLPRDQWVSMQKQMVAQERWIVDGNYDSTLPIRLERAEMIVYLSYSPIICVWRVIRRSLSGRPRPDMNPDCKEKLFSKDFAKFIWWIIRFRIDNHPRVATQLSKFATNRTIITLKSPSQLELFLSRMNS